MKNNKYIDGHIKAGWGPDRRPLLRAKDVSNKRKEEQKQKLTIY